MEFRNGLTALAGIAGVLVAGSAVAQSAPDFKGRTLTVYISAGVGGGYDAYGRMLAAHIGRHLPGNPTVVATNLTGGGGRKLANFMYHAAPKDGSAFGLIHHTTVYDAAFGASGIKYDPTKFNWIGSMASFTSTGFAWHTTGIRTVEDARKKQIAMGASGAGATSYQYINLLNNMFGTRFRIVTGYKGAKAIYLAIEQREVDGAGGLAWASTRNSYGHWLKENKINVFVQFVLQRDPELPDVPAVIEFATTPEQKEILAFVFVGLKFARPFLAPPGLPKATADTLRSAFMAAATDPKLVAEAKKRRRDLGPVPGEEVQRLVGQVYNAPKTVIRKAERVLTGK